MRILKLWLGHRLAAVMAAVLISICPALAAPFAAIVMDARTGEVLYAQNAETRLHPASLTKMMTLYIAFEAIERGEISLDSQVTVSAHAAGQAPSRLGLKAGQKIALRYLIRAAAIKSANDAATAIGEAIGGSEAKFAERMNRTARGIGMKDSSFRNANGLTAAGHMSTARDMTVLGRRLFYDYPQYYNLFSRRSADAGIAKVASTNRRFLDAYDGADGIKTGYTSAAGFNLTASAHRGNKRVIATVFGGTSTAWRNQKMAELLDLGFQKSPNSAPVQKPAAPAYMAEAKPSPASPAAVAAASTVSASLRPQARPEDEAPAVAASAPAPEVLASIQEGIDAALAEVHAPDPATAGPAQAASTMALTEAAPSGGLARSLRPQARPQPPVAVAAAPAAAPAPAPAAAPAPAPMAAPVAVASAEPQLPDVDRLAAQIAGQGAAGADAPAAAMASASTFQTTAPQPETLALAEAMADDVASPSAKPAARPGTIMLMADASGDLADAPAPQEVVSRMSTSGGRNWGISIGTYNNRYNAERALLQMALTESATLDGALRKVVTRRGAFDATFVGLTRDMADAACRRLGARNHDCEVVSF